MNKFKRLVKEKFMPEASALHEKLTGRKITYKDIKLFAKCLLEEFGYAKLIHASDMKYGRIIESYVNNKGKIVFPKGYKVITKQEQQAKVERFKATHPQYFSAQRPFTLEQYKEASKQFYVSKEWRELRFEVLKENGGHCCLCGRGVKDGVTLHVDHIIPLSKDWSKRLDKDNLQVLCEDCNIGKSNKDNTDWR